MIHIPYFITRALSSNIIFTAEKIIRKISNGNRSKNGARFLEILLSTIETFKLQGKNPLEEMKKIIRASNE